MKDTKVTCGGIVTLMAAYPPLKRDRHFCGTNCLEKWMAAGGEGGLPPGALPLPASLAQPGGKESL